MASGPAIVGELLANGKEGEDEAVAILKNNSEGYDTVCERTGYSALAAAVKSDCFALCRILLSKGAAPNKKLDKLDGRSAIHWVAQTNNVKVCTLLLEKKADPCQPDDNGTSALHLACRNCAFEVAQNILDNTDFDRYRYEEQNNVGFTPATYIVYGFLRKDVFSPPNFPRALWDHLTKKLETGVGTRNTAGLCLYYLSLMGTGDLQQEKDVQALEDDIVEVVQTLLSKDSELAMSAEYHDYIRDEHDVLEEMIENFDDANEETHFLTSPVLCSFINSYSVARLRIIKMLCAAGADVNEIYAPGPNEFSYPLLAASQLDDTDIADVLIKNGADMNTEPGKAFPDHAQKDATRLPFLFTLTRHFEFFLSRGGDPNVEDTVTGLCNTPIHYAVYLPDKDLRLEKLSALLKNGASVNITNQWGETALLAGLRPNFDVTSEPSPVDIAMVELLLNNNSSPDTCSGEIPGPVEHQMYGYTMPIHRAVIMDDIDLLELLMDAKADVNARTPSEGHPDVASKTPLLLACSMASRAPIAIEIAHKEVDLMAVDAHGKTALILAASHPPMEVDSSGVAWADVIYFLMDKCPELVNQADKDGITPLHAACEANNTEVVELLIGLNAGIKGDVNNCTPVHIAAKHANCKILDALMPVEGFNANEIEKTKEFTPLYLFPETDDQEVRDQALEFTKALLNAGADVRYMTTSKYTPVMEAINKGYKEIAVAYLENGGNKHVVSTDGASALSAACAQEMWDLAEDLVNSGADLSVRDEGGETPCMRALNAGKEQLVKLMISKGAQVDAVNDGGESLIVKLRRDGLVQDKVIIEYCKNCHAHKWTTRHNAETYEDWFQRAKNVFQEDGFEVLGNPTPPTMKMVNHRLFDYPIYVDRKHGRVQNFPPLGAFEIYIVSQSGEKYRLFSKIEKGYWPRLSIIRRNLERASVRINFPDQMAPRVEDNVEARRPQSARSEPGAVPRLTFQEDSMKPSPRSMQRPMTAR